MKTNHPTTHPKRRKRRAHDEESLHDVETETTQSPAQSLETLHNPQANHAARGAAMVRLQRAVGNAQVARELAQRVVAERQSDLQQSTVLLREDDESAESDQASDQEPTNEVEPPGDVSLDLPAPEPVTITLEELQERVPGYQGKQYGDFPEPADPNIAMAKRAEDGGAVQRDDDSLHLGVDVQTQYPLAMGVTLVYRNLNLVQLPSLLDGADILHEPSLQFSPSADSPDGLAGFQLSVGLFNQHIKFLGTELEAQILATLNYNRGDGGAGGQLSPGGGVQLEQHVWRNISLTFSVNGTWTPPQATTPGHLEWSPSAGAVIHFD